MEAPQTSCLLTLHDLYFEPKYEEFRPRTIWSLSNAFTSAFKELYPIPQCAMGRVDSDKGTFDSSWYRAMVLFMVIAAATLCKSPGSPSPAHPPDGAMLAVPRVQVPDVRGRRAEDAQAKLTERHRC